MPQGSTTLHESEDRLAPLTRDLHRALVSLMEELEAVDWYQQRVDASDDVDLREILRHNRDEEKEHAAMILEWIRRRDPAFAGHLKTYLFREGPIVGLEAAAGTNGGPDAHAGNGQANGAAHLPLGLGSLRAAR